MRKAGLLLVTGACLVFLGNLSAYAEDQPPAGVAKLAEDEIRQLRAENTSLKATMAQENKEVEALKAEIARLSEQVRQLQDLSRNAGIALPQPTTAPAVTPPEASKAEIFMYRGKPRSKAWFDDAYRRFADQIVRVDGKYLDVGKALVGGTEVSVDLVGMNCMASARSVECHVLQVIGKDEVIVSQGFADGRDSIVPNSVFHVQGVDTKNLVDGGKFEAGLVLIGPYHYGAVTGGGAAIPSYAVLTPLTKEQFAEALAGGLQLVFYRRVEEKKPGGGREFKVVGTPVP
jgi:hypothetical protein